MRTILGLVAAGVISWIMAIIAASALPEKHVDRAGVLTIMFLLVFGMGWYAGGAGS